MSEKSFLPETREEYVEDGVFFCKVVFLVVLGLSISKDVPEIDRSSKYPKAVQGECRVLDGSRFCFDTWKVLGFDTGLAPAVYRFDQGLDYLRVYSEIFFRESDFLLEKSSWPRGSRIHSGNYSGEIPDYNVTLVEGVGVE